MKKLFLFFALFMGFALASCGTKCDCANCETESCCSKCATETVETVQDSTGTVSETVEVQKEL